MDEKTKDRFWFGILLSFFFVVFTILAFVAITMTVGMDNEAQWIMIMYLLHWGWSAYTYSIIFRKEQKHGR